MNNKSETTLYSYEYQFDMIEDHEYNGRECCGILKKGQQVITHCRPSDKNIETFFYGHIPLKKITNLARYKITTVITKVTTRELDNVEETKTK